MPRPKKAAAPAAKKPTLAELEDRIVRFHQLNTARKHLEREEEELKEWFKEQANIRGLEASFEFESEDRGLIVAVTREQRTSLDQALLRKVVTADTIAACEKKVEFTKVSVREKTA